MYHITLTSKWKLKVVVAVLTMLLIAVPVVAGRPFSDVPEWAYQAVKKLVDGGYLELYEDGTFQGNNAVNRYTLAMVVAKMLVNIGEGVTPAGREDVTLLRKLSNEFQNELVLLTVKNKELEERLSKIEEGKMILAEDQTKNTSGIKLLSDEAKALRGEIAALQSEITKIAADILKEKRQVDSLEEKFSNLESAQEKQSVAIDDLRVQLEKEKRTNRILTIILGILGVAGIFLPSP